MDQIKFDTKDRAKLKNILDKFWPGNLTIIYKGQGYRMPKNSLLRDLIEDSGPLWSSSANLSSQQPITSFKEYQQTFQSYDDVVFVEGSDAPSGIPSTIYDYDNNVLIREGEIKFEDIVLDYFES